MKSNELIRSLIEQTEALPDFRDPVKLDALIRRAELIIRKLFGEKSRYADDLKEISFVSPPSTAVAVGRFGTGVSTPPPSPTPDFYWMRGKDMVKNLLTVMQEDIELAPNPSSANGEAINAVYSRKVFIVHGHDEEMKQSVARVLSQLEMEPIILHEQANRGRTLIEKFDEHSDVGFAVVLLSPDDVGRKKGTDANSDKPRARQNVVFELGYFIGRLTRSRVVPLLRSSGDFEKPTDIDGVVYVSYDSSGAWKFEIVKELAACGYNVDANKLL